MPAGMLSYLREQQSHHLLPGYMHMLVSGCAICVGLMSSTHNSPGLSTYWATTQTMVNLIKLKTYTENKTESIFITISYRNQLQEKSCKKHKYMKAKQYATKSPNEK